MDLHSKPCLPVIVLLDLGSSMTWRNLKARSQACTCSLHLLGCCTLRSSHVEVCTEWKISTSSPGAFAILPEHQTREGKSYLVHDATIYIIWILLYPADRNKYPDIQSQQRHVGSQPQGLMSPSLPRGSCAFVGCFPILTHVWATVCSSESMSCPDWDTRASFLAFFLRSLAQGRSC